MRALVVGLGHMGTFHRKVLLDLGYEVTTLDPDPMRGADLNELEQWTGDWPEVVALACPPSAFSQYVPQLDLKLLVEKPFALTYADGLVLEDCLGHDACVGYVERFNPQVRTLKQWIAGREVEEAQFIRWSDRPSWDVRLDLLSHDLDLAYYLGVEQVARYDTRCEEDRKVRQVSLRIGDDVCKVDLMDHQQSPLHALWHSFLSGGEVPRPLDALRVLEALEAPLEVAA